MMRMIMMMMWYSRDVSEFVLTAGVWGLVTDPREGLQLELLADRVEGEDLLGLYVRAESQIELEIICTFLSIKIFVILRTLVTS